MEIWTCQSPWALLLWWVHPSHHLQRCRCFGREKNGRKVWWVGIVTWKEDVDICGCLSWLFLLGVCWVFFGKWFLCTACDCELGDPKLRKQFVDVGGGLNRWCWSFLSTKNDIANGQIDNTLLCDSCNATPIFFIFFHWMISSFCPTDHLVSERSWWNRTHRSIPQVERCVTFLCVYTIYKPYIYIYWYVTSFYFQHILSNLKNMFTQIQFLNFNFSSKLDICLILIYIYTYLYCSTFLYTENIMLIIF